MNFTNSQTITVSVFLDNLSRILLLQAVHKIISSVTVTPWGSMKKEVCKQRCCKSSVVLRFVITSTFRYTSLCVISCTERFCHSDSEFHTEASLLGCSQRLLHSSDEFDALRKLFQNGHSEQTLPETPHWDFSYSVIRLQANYDNN